MACKPGIVILMLWKSVRKASFQGLWPKLCTAIHCHHHGSWHDWSRLLATQDLTARSQHNPCIPKNIIANRRAINFSFFASPESVEGQSVSFAGSAWMVHKLRLSVQRVSTLSGSHGNSIHPAWQAEGVRVQTCGRGLCQALQQQQQQSRVGWRLFNCGPWVCEYCGG
jgi:hypothetical protein